MIVKYKARFEKAFRRLASSDQQRTLEAVEQVERFFATRQAPEGLGLKKLFVVESLGAVCEARVTLAIRVLFSVQPDLLTFLMVGDHDEVRRFIKSFR
jgi:hypothetical protein